MTLCKLDEPTWYPFMSHLYKMYITLGLDSYIWLILWKTKLRLVNDNIVSRF